MKKPTIIFALSLLCILLPQGHAYSASVLQRLTKTGERTSIQIYCRFTELPQHQVTTNGRRVDLILADTILGSQSEFPVTDEHLIKIVSTRKETNTILSLYFRYPPQKTVVHVQKETASLMLDVLLGNPLSKKYPDLSTRLRGVTLLNRNEIDYTNPLQASSYAGNWLSFFNKYENTINISPPPHYSLPPFPLAAHFRPDLDSWLPKEARQMALDKEWGHLVEYIRGLLDKEQTDDKEALILTYAEALVRSHRPEDASTLLQHIILISPDSEQNHLARFLFYYLQAVTGDPYSANLELNTLYEKLGKKIPFPAYFNILQAETAMFTGRIKEAQEILARDDIAYTDTAKPLRLLRQADLRYMKNDKIQALVSYLQIKKTSDIVRSQPRSLAYFCDVLYTHNRMKTAAEQYDRLTELMIDSDQQDLALYRLAASRLRSGVHPDRIAPLLSQIQEAYPGSAGAYHAALKEIDGDFLNGTLLGVQAADAYGRIAITANTVSLREEAAFKQALIYAMTEEYEKCIDACMKILREFQEGKLHTETSALIVEHLSRVIKDFIDDGQYVRALVLAQKNRLFFARGWIDHSLLYEIAKAYTELGVYDRAVQTYQYLFDLSEEGGREEIYLPLIKSLFENREFGRLADFADRYLFRYPDNPDAAAIFLYRLQGLLQEGRVSQAAQLLRREHRPASAEIDTAAAGIYFDLARYQEVIDILTAVTNTPAADADKSFQLAESYFQINQFAQAAPLFASIEARNDKHRDQAIYRGAQINLEQGETERALNRFRKLAEKGTDSLWKKMASEQLNILNLQNIQ